MAARSYKPSWLEALSTQRFFALCPAHGNAKKNERNVCCIDCCTSICPHCVAGHRSHRLLQVRRYVYHDVVRLEDLEKLIDCSNVQSYTINSSKAVFLKKRPQNRQFKGSPNICTSCDRSLQEPYIHCSLGCKVDYLLRHKKDLSSALRACKTLQLSPDYFIPHDGDDGGGETTTHSTVVEPDEPMISSDDSENNLVSTAPSAAAAAAAAGVVRKKRSGAARVCSLTASHDVDAPAGFSRRKGTPHRSPLC